MYFSWIVLWNGRLLKLTTCILQILVFPMCNQWIMDCIIRINSDKKSINIHISMHSKIFIVNAQEIKRKKGIYVVSEYKVMFDYFLPFRNFQFLPTIFPSLLGHSLWMILLTLSDTHQPTLRVSYNRRNIFNATLRLIPRTRLDQVPTNYSLALIGTFEVNIDANTCMWDETEIFLNDIRKVSLFLT